MGNENPAKPLRGLITLPERIRRAFIPRRETPENIKNEIARFRKQIAQSLEREALALQGDISIDMVLEGDVQGFAQMMIDSLQVKLRKLEGKPTKVSAPVVLRAIEK